MKITTLNLAGYKNWEEREQRIVSFINTNNADVLFFQEVKFDAALSALNQAALINNLLERPYSYTQASVTRIFETNGTESREGLAVLSRFPITESEALVLHKESDDKHTRIVQNIDIQIGDTIQKFSNVHFSNNSYSDTQFAELIAILLARSEQRIIVGDFNMSDVQTVRNVYSAEYIDSMTTGEYISFPSEHARFDYALIPKHYSFQSFATADGLSDHSALTFEV